VDNNNDIESSCSHCGHTRAVSRKYIGKKVKCKNCNTSYRITQPEATAQSEVIELTPEDTVTASARVAKIFNKNKVVTDEMLEKYGTKMSPDHLMNDFKGRGVSGIFLFTVIIHALLLVGSSLPYIQSTYFDSNPAEIEESKRKEMAFDDATTIVDEIAEKYDMQASDITDRFSKSGSRSDKVKDKKKSLLKKKNLPKKVDTEHKENKSKARSNTTEPQP